MHVLKEKYLHPNTALLSYVGGSILAKDLVKGSILMNYNNEPVIVYSNHSSDELISYYRIEINNIGIMVPELTELYLYDSTLNKINIYKILDYVLLDYEIRSYNKMFYNKVEFIHNVTKSCPIQIGKALFSDMNYKENTELYLIKEVKLIPEYYLYNSIDVRTKILKGILNKKQSRCAISGDVPNIQLNSHSKVRFGKTTISDVNLLTLNIDSETLLEQLFFIAISLGHPTTVKNDKLYIQYKNSITNSKIEYSFKISKINGKLDYSIITIVNSDNILLYNTLAF